MLYNRDNHFMEACLAGLAERHSFPAPAAAEADWRPIKPPPGHRHSTNSVVWLKKSLRTMKSYKS